MGFTTILVTMLSILCLCSSGLYSSNLGLRATKWDFKNSATYQLSCCCSVIIAASMLFGYLAVQAP